MGDGQSYLGIALFVLFLITDIVLYAFSAAISEINESEIEKKASDGNKKAILIKKLTTSASTFRDTLDIVVFITNVVAGAFILGAIHTMVQKGVEADYVWMPALISFVMLLILIVFGVIVPKKCGKRNPEKTAFAFVGAVNFIVIILYPINRTVTFLAKVILRLFGIHADEANDSVTEEEIITMVNEGQEQGVFEASEAEMIANIFELGDKNAGDIMTHRSSIIALDCHMTLEKLIQEHIDGKYSRFPVYEGDIDNIVGTLHIRDALILYRNIPNRKKEIGSLKALIRPAFFVPDTRDIDDLLKDMQAEKIHMGVVVDEYGQTVGLISMEDIIEEIVGNILDEYDDEEQDIIKQNTDDSYVVDGLTELGDLSRLLGSEIKSEDFDTLNGYLISKLDRIPEENEQIEVLSDGFRFKVLEVSGNVIRKVEIEKYDSDKEADQ